MGGPLFFLAKFHQNLSTKFSLLVIHFQILIHWVIYFIVLNCDKKVSFFIYEQNIWSYVHSVLKTEFCCALKISAVWLLLNWRDYAFNSSLRKKICCDWSFLEVWSLFWLLLNWRYHVFNSCNSSWSHIIFNSSNLLGCFTCHQWKWRWFTCCRPRYVKLDFLNLKRDFLFVILARNYLAVFLVAFSKKSLNGFGNSNGSSTCPLISFFWLLSHVIYLKLTRIL